MPDTKQQYGLPFQGLPGTQRDLTPESMLKQEIQTGRQNIYNKYNLQYKEARRSARFIGQGKSQRMQQEIFAKAKQEMLQFNQQAEQQMAQLRNVDRLAQQGAITNPDEIKARMTFGTDVAKSMYPTPGKEPSIPEQFGKLDVYSHRIDQELEWFKEDKPKQPSKALFALGPIIGMAGAYRRLLAAKKRKVRIWDPATEDYTIKATPEKIAEYDMWLQEKRDVAARKMELLGQPDITRRTAQPGAGSGFDAGVTGSIKKPKTRRHDPLGLFE